MGNEEKSKIPALRTLKTESAEFVRRKNISLADMAIAESKKRREQQKRAGIQNTLGKKKVIILAGGASLAVVVGFSVWFFLKPNPVAQTIAAPPPLIFSEKEETIKIQRKADLKESLLAALQNQKLKNREIKNFNILQEFSEGQKEFLNGNDFLTSITSPPLGLIQALSGKYYLGMFKNTTENRSYPILIFETNSFDRAFAGMLDWEKTLKRNLLFLMPGTMNLTTKNPIFVDEVIKNHDTRLIRNIKGKPILLYTFFNRQTLVITFDQKTLEETLKRLEQSLPLN